MGLPQTINILKLHFLGEKSKENFDI